MHHIFHSEHNRLVGVIDGMLHDPTLFTAAELADWQAVSAARANWTYNERLFQAARFVTEMQYQHLAFEEFVRKVQPMVNLFGEGGTGYHTEINPAIRAEFAHAVYRFGHSMLTETVDRTTPTGVNQNIPLLDAFLNPPAFMAPGQTPENAAGNVIRGMTRQIGNELDEFVTERPAEPAPRPPVGPRDAEHGSRSRRRDPEPQRGTRETSMRRAATPPWRRTRAGRTSASASGTRRRW